MRKYTRIYIDGAWVHPFADKTVDIINPATEQNAGKITLCTDIDVDRAVSAARTALETYSHSTKQERLDLLTSILSIYVKRQSDLADALTEELGAPRKFAREVQVGVGLLHLQSALSVLKDYKFEIPQSDRTLVKREPIGVVCVITPWNWPIIQAVVKICPALATGCTVVHKPSEIAPFSAHILAEIFDEAGVPEGVYNLIDGNDVTIGRAISDNPGVDMVSFTGTTVGGLDVPTRGAMSIKRVHHELGGRSPNIILDDADLEKSVTENIHRQMLNSGQTCHAPSRMLVPSSRLQEAKAIAAQVISTITCGDPKTDVYLGPVVSQLHWDRVESLIHKGIAAGATLISGGTGRPDGLETGFYVKPTIFADVTNDMAIAQEEIFGPVLCIIRYDDIDDAVSIANDTMYGLAAYVQSASNERANKVAERLKASVVFVNGALEDPAAPFGGYKRSGNGREWTEIAFGEFLETKAIIHKTEVV